VVVVLIILLGSLKSLATLYTDSLWFGSVNLHSVFTKLLGVKLGLFFVFGAIFFAILWINLIICDRLGQRAPEPPAEDELVRRYQQTVGPYAGRLYIAIAVVIGLIAGAGTVGEWNNWLLFTHAVPFGMKDPQFHIDDSFFVFRLPFLMFLVNWTLVVLFVVTIITALFHYLNGGIRAQRVSPRVSPSVKAHLSVLLALIALAKAAGYVLQRYQLDVSGQGYVNGAGYTDVHARMPALLLLSIVSVLAALILLYNIRLQGWTLPVLAIGVWAFVALVIGVIYPAILQALKVSPAQSSLELPYIQRNIQATRAAYGLNDIQTESFAGSNTVSPGAVAANMPTLSNIRLWDPDGSISLPTFQKLQNIWAYYTQQVPPTSGLMTVDRYTVDGKMRPVIVGVRQVDASNLPSSSWVNAHLVYTHGEGMVLAQANRTTANGSPSFSISSVPSSSSNGLPQITQPDVYFGLNNPGYVVADTKQKELDYETSSGKDIYTSYKGGGGVKMGGFLTKAAFFLRLGDFNLLISSLITPDSRIMFVRDIQSMAQKAAPFLSFDANPYAVLVDGHIDFIQDAYTTTSQYPYSQNANTAQTPPNSNLPASFNYVRNSVKIVINAYTGQMTFYAMDNDPILRAYEEAFPHMFVPKSKMSSVLKAHLRYPEDIFSIQAAMDGRYHVTQPANFYSGGNAWSLSPTTGVGSNLAVTQTTNAQGQVTSSPPQRMSPLYQVLQEPGEHQQSFTISDAYVPASQNNPNNQILTAFMMANSDPSQYGQIKLFQTPPGVSVVGPAQADSEIQQNAKVSQQITYLDQHGSEVILGNVLMIPIDQSMLYVRPMYVSSTGNPLPQLKFVIAVYGQAVGFEPSINLALSDVLGTPVSVPSSNSTTPAQPSVPTPGSAPSSGNTSGQSQAQQDLSQALNDYAAAQKALAAGGPNALGTYQNDINAAQALVAQAQQALAAAGSSTGTAATATATSSTTTSSTTTSSTTTSSSVSTAPRATTSSGGKGSHGSTPSSTTTKGTTASAGGPPAGNRARSRGSTT